MTRTHPPTGRFSSTPNGYPCTVRFSSYGKSYGKGRLPSGTKHTGSPFPRWTSGRKGTRAGKASALVAAYTDDTDTLDEDLAADFD